jgi:hypothetical protein
VIRSSEDDEANGIDSYLYLRLPELEVDRDDLVGHRIGKQSHAALGLLVEWLVVEPVQLQTASDLEFRYIITVVYLL